MPEINFTETPLFDNFTDYSIFDAKFVISVKFWSRCSKLIKISKNKKLTSLPDTWKNLKIQEINFFNFKKIRPVQLESAFQGLLICVKKYIC